MPALRSKQSKPSKNTSQKVLCLCPCQQLVSLKTLDRHLKNEGPVYTRTANPSRSQQSHRKRSSQATSCLPGLSSQSTNELTVARARGQDPNTTTPSLPSTPPPTHTPLFLPFASTSALQSVSQPSSHLLSPPPFTPFGDPHTEDVDSAMQGRDEYGGSDGIGANSDELDVNHELSDGSDSDIDSDTGEPFLLEDPEYEDQGDNDLGAYWETDAADASTHQSSSLTHMISF